MRAVEAFFYWDCLEEDVAQFCRMCLHGIGSLESKVPRPLREALHASRRNQVVHYLQLVVSERTDHVVIVHALVDWYKRFGIAETPVGDKGSHFKNKVVAELNDLLKTKHHLTTAYSPKSNGTVEKVNCLPRVMAPWRKSIERSCKFFEVLCLSSR